MRTPGFPFPALVGLDALTMALQLTAIDSHLSVVVRGDKGAGKSTAVRGLVDLLPEGAPFVTLPIGATEDRLLGGLDVEKALKGEPALKPGLLAAANGGVLYIDEVNLLPDHLADALLDAVASGLHVVEREGFSVTQASRFTLVGSMNPDEGTLRPQMLDRFALAVDVSAPVDPVMRREVIDRRLRYDADPQTFCAAWRAERLQMARRLGDARTRLPGVTVPGQILELIAARVTARNVRSLRADLAVVRGSRALAALEGAAAVDASHVEALLPLALAHRTSTPPPESPPAPAPAAGEANSAPDAADRPGAVPERIFPPLAGRSPRLIVEHAGNEAGSSSRSTGRAAGVTIGVRQTADPRELDARTTVLHAVVRSGSTALCGDDLHERVRRPDAGTRYLFVIDSSGSHALQERMSAVKGAVKGLLESVHGRRDEVVVIACRGGVASLLVGPTSILDDVQRALECLPTGGRTPLAHALELAATYVTDAAVVVIVTDGHANVPSRSDDPWADALDAARAIACPSIVIDSEDEQSATGRPRQLADAMRGGYARLTDLDRTPVLQVIRRIL
ncbi:MAG TPA: VWA domain-containing protein [Vicinamibacterales bacterium]|nr:VWA domain-containing protein [Vicinamibacterales bacterium]